MTKSTSKASNATNKSKINRAKWRKAKRKDKRKLKKESATRIKIYYSIYRGWSVDFTACFNHPVFAFIWCRWMLWKDLILHYWHGQENIPTWHNCVGVCEVDRNNLTKVQKVDGIWGKLTQNIFQGVDVYRHAVLDNVEMRNHELITFSEDCVAKCSNFFKTHADYQQSTGSIFRCRGNNDMVTLSKEITCLYWINITCESIGLGNNLPSYQFMDVARSARERVKNRINDRDGGK